MTTFVPDRRTGRRDASGDESTRAEYWLRAVRQGGSGLRHLPLVALVTDTALLMLAVILASAGRGLFSVDDSTVVFTPRFWVAAPVVTLGWLLSIKVNGGYESKVFGAGATELRRVLNSGLANAALIGVGCYLARFPLSRGWFVMVFVIGMPLLLAGRLGLRQLLKRSRQRGFFLQRVLLVGDGPHIDDVASVLERESWLGYDVVGALAPLGSGPITPGGVPIIGPTLSVAANAELLEVDIVFFAGGAVASSAHLRRAAWQLEHSDIQVVVAPSLTDVSSERISVRPVGGLPLIHLEKPRSVKARRRAKRLFDVIGSAALLVLLSPVYLIAAAQIWLHDRGPLLYRQERIGRDGVPFRCLKFRSMVVDADRLLAQTHAAAGSDANEMFYKLKDDPRITRPGRWLRRLSLDELPQLMNVLRGDMSLVGPRPQVAHEVALYDDAMARRLHVRPGMTGLWQVSGRSDLSIEEAVRLDLYYVDNWSMVQDLAILGRTFGAVVGSRGAY